MASHDFFAVFPSELSNAAMKPGRVFLAGSSEASPVGTLSHKTGRRCPRRGRGGRRWNQKEMAERCLGCAGFLEVVKDL